jgi:Baseplate J-like protein
VTRSTEDIHPPAVVRLTISYSLCKAVPPNFVLTSDSGSLRDQSNANRSSGAIVEAFVPLAVTLGRLLNGAAAADQANAPCPPPCDCPGQSATTTASTATPALQTAPTSTARCLLVGISGSVSGAPVNLLVMVAEKRDHGKFAPLTVEALAANRLVPIVASDGTRAIGESGLISMSFAVSPSSAELFGQPLIWLRFAPKAGTDTSSWQPTIAGAYINAVFASARETLTRELVGSSDGSPNLTLKLARPPLLHDSLELRVREPLGDEERKDLQKQGLVVSDDPDLPGDWVKWKQVPDPGDELAAARVYALDESIGEIRFGDGLHGMIPPIDRDSIVAFQYQRTEPPAPGVETVPGNAITARTTLNLVSPVETVESVTSAGDSAGGTAPEPDDLVLQFGYARIRHHDRAVTLRDFEDIARESSPAILQARAFARPGGAVQLTVVMHGRDPHPTAAQIRELRRYLLSFAPPALALPQALTIAGPEPRPLRLELTLDIATLDAAADVSVAVKKRVAALFDPGQPCCLPQAASSNRRMSPMLSRPGTVPIAVAIIIVRRVLAEGPVGSNSNRPSSRFSRPIQSASSFNRSR